MDLKRPPRVLLAVNGGLMRGLQVNYILQAAGAVFVRDDLTEPAYRFWSINDIHPAMVRVNAGGVPILVEIWSLTLEALTFVLLNEPPGLTIGRVVLANGSEVLGVIGEPAICEGQKEITTFGGWRAYLASLEVEPV